MFNPTQRGKVVEMGRPIPDNETDRTAEARHLLSFIYEKDLPKLTSWERNTVEEIREGKASTTIRLKELRSIVKRLQDAHNQDA
jgi:hypothetical protein